jgi:hypothetical protein
MDSAAQRLPLFQFAVIRVRHSLVSYNADGIRFSLTTLRKDHLHVPIV